MDKRIFQFFFPKIDKEKITLLERNVHTNTKNNFDYLKIFCHFKQQRHVTIQMCGFFL